MSENGGFPDEAPLSLDDILNDDLLIAPEKTKKITSSDRLERAFLEIIDFRRAEGRPPSSYTREIAERKLGARLDGFLADEAKFDAVRHLDEFGLLEAQVAPATIDELLESDDLGELLGDDAGIFDISDLPVIKRPEAADSVAQRIKAKDFESFAPLFKIKHAELADGTSTLRPFTGMDLIKEGTFFVLNGVMCFIAEVGEKVDMVIGGVPRKKQRLRLIFENGTESAMYDKSLQTRMYETQGQVLARNGVEMSEILDPDVESGHIYVLQSMSADPLISNIKDLHKIGFSTTSVEQRLQGASSSPTYLMAPVKIVADYRVYNLKTSALENLLHRVFAEVRLDLAQIDSKGHTYDPSEWFIVPREVINKAVAMIMSGEITEYVYDKITQRMVKGF